MLTLAGRLCQERGVRRVGIGVGVDNALARALYERFGFALVPASEHRVLWLAPAPSGPARLAYEDCVYLIKEPV